MTLEAIADQTKIRLPLLEALERDDVRHWPGGIFRRAYLRTYARAIGLDAEATVREFLELYPDPTEQADEVLEAAKAMTGTDTLSRRPRTRLQFLLDSALGALPRRGRHPESAGEQRAATSPVRDEHSSTRHVGIVDTPDMPPASLLDDLEVPELPHQVLEAHFPEPLTAVADDRAELEPSQEFGATNLFAPIEPTLLAQTNDAADVDVAADTAGARDAFAVDLAGVALLCSTIARARTIDDVAALMADAARLLHAEGVILWMWDDANRVLWPSLSHGYRSELLARLPNVRPDTDNAIAASFRTAETRVVDGGQGQTGAVVVPVITPGGCTGVLALELRGGGERHESVHALATILAAQLAAATYAPPLAQSTPA